MAACVVLAALGASTGCGNSSGLDLAPVTGTVTYQGERLAKGNVVFTPAQGTTGPIAVGVISPDGTFAMRSGEHEGAVVGSHHVTVHCRRDLTEAEVKARVLIVPDSLIPEKYSKQDQSPLNYDVVAGEDNVYDIVLE